MLNVFKGAKSMGNRKPAALSPSRRVFRLSPTYVITGATELFLQIDVGSPPALSPSLAGSQRIGGREAADPLTSDKLQLVVDAESVRS